MARFAAIVGLLLSLTEVAAGQVNFMFGPPPTFVSSQSAGVQSMSESHIRKLAALFPLTGLACAVFYSLTAWSEIGGWKAVVHALGTFLLVAGASFLGSGLIGFLFGFPRSVDRSENEPPPGRRYAQGKSIEQIADWGTKMLIGVGLSQMNAIPHTLWYYSSRLTTGITTIVGPDGATSVGVCLIVYFFVCGFIEGYLVTRLRLPSLLAEVDSKSVEPVISSGAPVGGHH